MINPAILYFSGSAPDLITKYIFATSVDVNSGPELIVEYSGATTGVTGTTNASVIEVDYFVGLIPTGATIVITYTRGSAFLKETIYVDITNSSTFWADINGWLYANNISPISFDSGLNQWAITDITNLTYIHLLI